MKRMFNVVVILLTSLAACSSDKRSEHGTVTAPVKSVPVTIGGDGDVDACPSLAVPRGSAGEVRKGPGEEFPVVEHLGKGRAIFVCGDQEQWFGVVYPGKDAAADECGVSSPIEKRQAYTGPCKSGWIRSDALDIVAG